MEPSSSERFAEDLLEWSHGNLRSFWWRDPEISLYKLLVTEIFLARTRSRVVEDTLPELFERYPNMQAIKETQTDDIAEIIRPLGLHNRRAEAVKEIAERLDGDVPEDLETLLDLPRVGPYVANATLCFGLGRQLPIIDSNVDRVYRRLFGDRWEAMNDDERWALATEILPEGSARRYNLALLDFASLVCTPRSPECEQCFASEYCTYYSTSNEPQDQAP